MILFVLSTADPIGQASVGIDRLSRLTPEPDRGVSHRALLCDVGPGRGRSACCDSPDRGCGGLAAARGSAWAVGAVARCPGFGDGDVRRVPHRTPRARGGDAPGTRAGSTGVDGGTAREPRDR